jgi:hypothetical protein
VLRLLAVLLLATLLGSGGVAAGIVAGVPPIVQFVFVASLTLFIVTLATGASFARAGEGAHPKGRSASVGAIAPYRRPDLQRTDPTGRARRRVARAGARLQSARRMSARRRRRSLPSLVQYLRRRNPYISLADNHQPVA